MIPEERPTAAEIEKELSDAYTKLRMQNATKLDTNVTRINL